MGLYSYKLNYSSIKLIIIAKPLTRAHMTCVSGAEYVETSRSSEVMNIFASIIHISIQSDKYQ